MQNLINITLEAALDLRRRRLRQIISLRFGFLPALSVVTGFLEASDELTRSEEVGDEKDVERRTFGGNYPSVLESDGSGGRGTKGKLIRPPRRKRQGACEQAECDPRSWLGSFLELFLV